MATKLTICPVEHYAKTTPEKIAIQAELHSITYLELHWEIERLCEQLISLNIIAGNRLACITNQRLNLIILQCACIRLNIIYSPINPKFTSSELEQKLAVLATEFIYFDSDFKLKDLLERPVKCLSLHFSFRSDVALQPKVSNSLNKAFTEKHHKKITGDAPCNIIFTSGSTGQSKAVMHSFNNHCCSAALSKKRVHIEQSDRCLLSLPLFHISGYATVMRTLFAGATLVISHAKITTKLLKTEKITHLSLVATQLVQLLTEQDFSQKNLSLKHLLLGGSHFPSRLLDELACRGFTYHLSYGLTEMSSQVATSTNGNELIILDEQSLKIVDNEIWLRGDTAFKGYFSEGGELNFRTKKEWFASNDLGKIAGSHLVITGRKDRQFISGGENVHPEEIEAELQQSEFVEYAIVVSVEDLLFGQRPVAFITWRNNRAEIKKLTQQMQSELIKFKQPILYLELPKIKGTKHSLSQLEKIAKHWLGK